MQSNVDVGKEPDQYFAAMAEQFIQKATEMGYEFTDVKDFIEDRGMPENDMNLLINGMRNPQNYNNVLFKGNQNFQYDFADPQMDMSRQGYGMNQVMSQQ